MSKGPTTSRAHLQTSGPAPEGDDEGNTGVATPSPQEHEPETSGGPEKLQTGGSSVVGLVSPVS